MLITMTADHCCHVVLLSHVTGCYFASGRSAEIVKYPAWAVSVDAPYPDGLCAKVVDWLSRPLCSIECGCGDSADDGHRTSAV
jgi:hypothetical protein